MRLPRHIEPQFAQEYLLDFDVAGAAERCGVIRSAKYFGNALLKRPRVQALIRTEMESRRIRLQIDADFVLQSLMQQYVRLTGMLGHDIGALYASDGAIKPISEWPTVWRTRLITEIHSEDTFEYSTDGVQAEKSKTRDKAGVVTKIKRETHLGIERELRETLLEIGRHVNVRAFPAPASAVAVQGGINVTIVHVGDVAPREIATLPPDPSESGVIDIEIADVAI